MQNNKNRNFFATLEVLLDIALNFSSFFIAYFIAVLIVGGKAEAPTPAVMIFAFSAVLMQSLIFMLSSSYAKGITLQHKYYRTLLINVFYFTAIGAVAYYYIDEWQPELVLATVAVATLLSTAFAFAKYGIAARVSGFLNKRGYSAGNS